MRNYKASHMASYRASRRRNNMKCRMDNNRCRLADSLVRRWMPERNCQLVGFAAVAVLLCQPGFARRLAGW